MKTRHYVTYDIHHDDPDTYRICCSGCDWSWTAEDLETLYHLAVAHMKLTNVGPVASASGDLTKEKADYLIGALGLEALNDEAPVDTGENPHSHRFSTPPIKPRYGSGRMPYRLS